MPMIYTFLCCLSSSSVRPPVRGLPFCFLIPFWQSYGIYSLARASPAAACVSSCWGKENCWGQYRGGARPSPHQCLCRPLSLHSSAPKGCTTFGITASPGVVVDVAHSPPAKKSITGASKWPLDPELEVTLQVKAASSSTDDQKVGVMIGVGVGTCWVGWRAEGGVGD